MVAVESAGRQIPISFLGWVREDFNKSFGGGKAATAMQKSMKKELGSKLKEHTSIVWIIQRRYEAS